MGLWLSELDPPSDRRCRKGPSAMTDTRGSETFWRWLRGREIRRESRLYGCRDIRFLKIRSLCHSVGVLGLRLMIGHNIPVCNSCVNGKAMDGDNITCEDPALQAHLFRQYEHEK
jgi:hypothetical protein